MSPARLTPRALTELQEATRWIAKDSSGAARALRAGVAKVAEHIATFPKSGAERPDLAPAPYRFIGVPGFSYVLVYNAERRPPLIVRVVHGARNLGEVLRPFSGS
ncbi:MAG: type II toxin-antitoxin system RelE/ParE family toxin [Caulobacteraceae bacterium]